MKTSHAVRTLGITFLMLVVMACSLPAALGGEDPGMEETRIALGVQQTSLAVQQSTLEAAQGAAASNNDTSASSDSSAPAVQPTYTPFPTYTPYPTSEPTAEAVPQPSVSMEERIRGANVLIYEDIWGELPLSGNRRVSDAVNRMNFSGGRIINTGDAMGTFKEHLLSGTSWDLIIVSAERRDSIQGEFWDYIMAQLDHQVALIAEVWYLDEINFGRVSPFLSSCGVSVQAEWDRGINYNQLDYSILIQDTTHPIFNQPNSGISLVTPNIYWMGDAGDIIKLSTGGDATLLAGTVLNHPSDYGVLASCMGGRVILQTFSTHDYRYDQTVPLWENYIEYTLTNHFLALE